MPSSPSRRDPLREPSAASAQYARPQHHGIFLEPRYTVELPPLYDGEGEDEGGPADTAPDRSPSASDRPSSGSDRSPNGRSPSSGRSSDRGSVRRGSSAQRRG
ncbi:hypothetical protein KQY30_34210 [Streptomyces sp. GMY02]|uniref:hypothetical protein n=1 Tax=Streptomyces sp. GMY02 TaxID=1333528 RepID=UPI001C2BA932|nr:hypothetical protein [Streptomyces sp. GMY02]QXE38534.1 hypothetical protein KQY30_34210 [Streptomyces sp. GMY02]